MAGSRGSSIGTAREGDLLAVRRPRNAAARALLERRHRARFAAVDRDDVNLRLLAARREKGDLLAIRRPLRVGVGRRAAGELARFAGFEVHQPDGGEFLFFLGIDVRNGVGGKFAIRRKLPAGDELQPKEIGWFDGTFFLGHVGGSPSALTSSKSKRVLAFRRGARLCAPTKTFDLSGKTPRFRLVD